MKFFIIWKNSKYLFMAPQSYSCIGFFAFYNCELNALCSVFYHWDFQAIYLNFEELRVYIYAFDSK